MLSRRAGVRRGRAQRTLRGSVDQRLYLSLDGRDLGLRVARLGCRPRPRNRISCSRRLEIVRGAVVLDVPVVVRHQAHRVALDEGRPLALPRPRRRLGDRVANREWIASVDRHRRNAVARGPIRQPGEGHRLRDRCHLRPAVVLADEHDRQPSGGRKRDPLVQRTLVDRAVSERDDGYAPGSEEDAREGTAGCNRNAGADDRVLADEAEPGRHHIGRSCSTAVDAGSAMAALGKQLVDSDAALECPPVARDTWRPRDPPRRSRPSRRRGSPPGLRRSAASLPSLARHDVLSSRHRSSNRRMIEHLPVGPKRRQHVHGSGGAQGVVTLLGADEVSQELTHASNSDRFREVSSCCFGRLREDAVRAPARRSPSRGSSGSDVRSSWSSVASAALQTATFAYLPGILQIRTMLPASCSAFPRANSLAVSSWRVSTGELCGKANLDPDEELHHDVAAGRPVARPAQRTMTSRYVVNDVGETLGRCREPERIGCAATVEGDGEAAEAESEFLAVGRVAEAPDLVELDLEPVAARDRVGRPSASACGDRSSRCEPPAGHTRGAACPRRGRARRT